MKDIKYRAFAFDWDDNILFMPTTIIVMNDRNQEVEISTSDFAEYRDIIGKKKFNYKGNIIVGYPKKDGKVDFDEAYRNFRDFNDSDIFLKDTKKAIEDKKFGPSWEDFIDCLTSGNLFAIITARGHLDKSIRKAIEWIIDNFLTSKMKDTMYNNLLKFAYFFNIDYEKYDRIFKGEKFTKTPLCKIYLDNCEYIGISSPTRGGVPDNPEKAKEEAFLKFKQRVNNFSRRIGTKARIGFSDDDIKNVEHIIDYVKDIGNEDYKWIKDITVKKTHKREKDVYIKTFEMWKNYKKKMNFIKSFKIFEDYKPNKKQKAAFVKWSNKKNQPEALEYMDRFFLVYPKLKNKDINFYKNLEELKAAIEKAESKKTAKDIKRAAKKNSIKTRIDNYEVILTLTPEASSFYGAGTIWCTSMRDEVYHWLLHRIFGVEFYLINHDLPSDNTNHKVSIHINWDKKYSTIYDSENKVTFDGKTHEFTDINEINNFIGNQKVFDWIMQEFETIKKDAPKFVPTLLKKFVKDNHMKKVFEKYHLLKYSIENYLEMNNDILNEAEFDYLNDINQNLGLQWYLEYCDWFKNLSLNQIIYHLGQIESPDDHVIIMELFDYYLFNVKNNFKEEFYSCPILFDVDDENWLESLGLDPNSDLLDQIEKFYEDFQFNHKKTRFETHLHIIESFNKTF